MMNVLKANFEFSHTSQGWKVPNFLIQASERNGNINGFDTKDGTIVKEPIHKRKPVVVEKTDGATEDWLSYCVVGQVIVDDTIPDLGPLLRQAGFMECEVRYVEGFQYIFECPNRDLMLMMLAERKDKLSRWFEWVVPSTLTLEFNRLRRLLWLSVQGEP